MSTSIGRKFLKSESVARRLLTKTRLRPSAESSLRTTNSASPDARLFEQRLDLRVRAEREESFDRRVALARANHLGREPVAYEHAERVNDDRLARARLARQKVQAAVELDLQLAYQREVRDVQEREHSSSSIPRETVFLRPYLTKTVALCVRTNAPHNGREKFSTESGPVEKIIFAARLFIRALCVMLSRRKRRRES